MSNNWNNRINIISGIASDLLDQCTAKRAKLLAKQNAPKRNWKKPLLIAVAAMLVLAVSVSMVFLLLGDGKQIPVYRGMTVSSDAPALMNDDPMSYRYFALYDRVLPEFAILAHNEPGSHDNRPDHSTTVEEDTTLDPESGASLYYAKPNEDFYITVHIDNPDNFEILSFTLNGKKYSSYMFEEGSDMENLILKCNVGDATGIVEYTIDAIKYVDETEIKDVRMDGDKTVKIGVYTANQPVASLAESTVTFSEIGFDVSVNAPQGLMSLLASDASVVLYKGGTAVDSKELSITDTTSVRFAGLDDGAVYRVAVIANYDAFDGAGKTEHTIGEKTVTTPAIVTPKADDVSYTKAVAKLVWHEDVTDKTAVSFALYKGKEKIRDLSGDEVKLTDLLSNAEYTLIVEYTHNGVTQSREVKFVTLTNEVPTIAITNPESDLHSVSFQLDEKDPLNLLTVSKIELLQGSNVVATATGSTIEFTDLEMLQTYTVKVTYSYDLLDGSGKQTNTLTQRFSTQSKGLKIEDGTVVGIGSCTDSKIYINMPIGDSAFRSCSFTEAVLGDGVTSISAYAFADCYQLKEINIPDGITELLRGTFYKCKSLTEITLPDSLTSLDAIVFYECVALSTINLPIKMTSIGEECFRSTPITEITIPEGITKLSSGLFMDCGQLTKIHWPNSVKEIGSWAFQNCSGMKDKELIIPDSVETIGEYAFYGCYNIVKIPTSVSTVNQSAFTGSSMVLVEAGSKPAGWHYEWADSTVTVVWNFKEFHTDSQGVKYAVLNNDEMIAMGYEGNAEELIIPEGVVEIAPYAFRDQQTLHKITLPKSLRAIGESAFENCGRLHTVELQEGLLTIGSMAFCGNSSLGNIQLPNSLTSIGGFAFQYCTSLQSIVIPEKITIIEGETFGYCSTLLTVILPKGLREISGMAFTDCINLQEIELPDGLEIIREYAFMATPVTKFVIPKSVSVIEEGAFYLSSCEIYCEAETKPSGWANRWVGQNPVVIWGYTG